MDQGGQDSLANKHGVRTPLHAKALIEELDHKQLVMLRDGRKIVGLFRSCDQFGKDESPAVAPLRSIASASPLSEFATQRRVCVWA